MVKKEQLHGQKKKKKTPEGETAEAISLVDNDRSSFGLNNEFTEHRINIWFSHTQ